MKYFTNCKTAEELKKAYKTAAKQLHPDNGGNEEQFKEMQIEFSAAWDRLKNIHVNANNETYEKETTETAREFMNLVNDFLNISGVEVELCGSWIWISGNTKEIKDQLKAKGFRWSAQKIAWYWHEPGYHKRGSKKFSLDDIRDMYGSAKYQNKKEYDQISA